MNQLKYIVSLWMVSLLVFSGCTETVMDALPNGGHRLVVGASINWEKGTDGREQIIKLRQSTPYFASQSSIPVTGAIVRVIKDDDGTVFNFRDQDNGMYKATDFIPELRKSYTLEIEHNNKSYTAS